MRTKEVRSGLITLIVGTALSHGAIKFADGVADDLNHERARRNVQLVIDKDKNRVITNEEWVPVYQSLGFPGSGQYGLDLSTNQLRSYLVNNPQSK